MHYTVSKTISIHNSAVAVDRNSDFYICNIKRDSRNYSVTSEISTAHITDALQSGCEKCTGKQRRSIRKVIKHLIRKENAYWNQLVDMYDPNRTYSQMYERELGSI